MRGIVCNEDLRARARRRLPKAIFDYIDRGSYSEITLAGNRRALDGVRLVQRVLRDVSNVTTQSTMLDETVSLPVALGPTGLSGLIYPEGEIHACRAAHNQGVPYCLSTASICSIEEVRMAVEAPFWFQLYIMRDRGFVQSLVDRAAAAGSPVLIVTVDLAAQGQRHQDLRNGLSVPPRITARNAMNLLTRPRWLAGMLRTPHRSFGNFRDYAGIGTEIGAITRWINTQFDASLTWRDIDWLRSLWKGKLVVKGILSVEDAVLAHQHGADALVVSNHGGRQLDGAKPSLDALPEIVDALQGACKSTSTAASVVARMSLGRSPWERMGLGLGAPFFTDLRAAVRLALNTLLSSLRVSCKRV